MIGLKTHISLFTFICVGSMLLVSCDAYQKTFNNDKPKNHFALVDSIPFVLQDFYVLGICEDNILYSYEENQNGVPLMVSEEVPVKAYYNKGGKGVCPTCKMVEETYLYLANFNSKDSSSGLAFYMPTYRTFVRRIYTSDEWDVSIPRDAVSPTERGYDIGRFMSHPYEMNFTIVRDVMVGQWWTPDTNKPDSIFINLPADNHTGYFTVGAKRMIVSENEEKDALVFERITSPTIDTYAGEAQNLNYMIPINGAIRLENDTSGLTFYHLPDERKVMAGYIEKHDVESLALRSRACRKKGFEYSFELNCIRGEIKQTKYFWKREKRLKVVR